jgi:hypothetical protein
VHGCGGGVPLPFPLSLTLILGFFGSLDEMLIVAVSLPVNAGLNVTLTEHELPFATTVQVSVSLKSLAFVPPNVIGLFIVRSDMPVFLIVITLAADMFPTAIEPKLTDVGKMVIFGGGACPMSFTLMVGFLGSLDEILIIAIFLPKGTVGLNVTVIGHEFFAGIVEQLFV